MLPQKRGRQTDDSVDGCLSVSLSPREELLNIRASTPVDSFITFPHWNSWASFPHLCSHRETLKEKEMWQGTCVSVVCLQVWTQHTSTRCIPPQWAMTVQQPGQTLATGAEEQWLHGRMDRYLMLQLPELQLFRAERDSKLFSQTIC